MLSKVPQYHGITRRCTVAVGGLFSNIYILTKDSTGKTKKIVNVPLAYLNKEKFIQRLQQDPALDEDVMISLPRMSFEIVGYEYDTTRQLNKVNKISCTKDGFPVHMYSPVPYNIIFSVYSYTKTVEDNLQIMEQILPYFTPDMNLSIKMMQNPDLIQDCSFTLNSVATDDAYDGSFESTRYIITTYTFTLKMNYLGPIYGLPDPEGHFDAGSTSSVIKKVTVNVNNTKYTATIDPFEAEESDPHSIVEEWADNPDAPPDWNNI
jgi:hypothetical protein